MKSRSIFGHRMTMTPSRVVVVLFSVFVASTATLEFEYSEDSIDVRMEFSGNEDNLSVSFFVYF